MEIIKKHRNLPHWHRDGCLQFVTFHLADSLPSSVRADIQKKKDIFLKANPDPWSDEVRIRFNTQFPSFINNYLDAGYGCCCLRRKECAVIMVQALEHFNCQRYILHDYVVMPNHVHVLVEITSVADLSQICKSWKNYTALLINRLIGKSGKFWHHESWDRMIRDEKHYNTVKQYIAKNIRQAGVAWFGSEVSHPNALND